MPRPPISNAPLRDEYEPMMWHAIHDSPVPTIAAVNGTAAGAGASLALSCDVVIATHSAVFLQAFSRIGLIPDAGGTYMLPRLVGLARAMGASLFADEITAARQAAQWGMIYEAVSRMPISRPIGARGRGISPKVRRSPIAISKRPCTPPMTTRSRISWRLRPSCKIAAVRPVISKRASWPSLKNASRSTKGVKSPTDLRSPVPSAW